MKIDKVELTGVSVHFIGAGGCGMSGLAIAAFELGADVSGSDIREGVFTTSLRSRGLEISIGHSEQNLPKEGIVVYSSAISRSNLERIAAEKSESVRVMHRSAFLELISRGRLTVAVAGSHGKTTTSAMLAHVLLCCGLDPSYVIGGLPNPPMKHGHIGRSNIFIIEADESDRSLLNYRPDTLIVTNVDLDHAGDGSFRTVEDTAEVFRQISERSELTLISAAASKYLSDLRDMTVCDYRKQSNGSYVSDDVRFQPSPPGEHQAQNIALVIGCSLKLGCKREEIGAAIQSFPGLHRRYNKIGTFESGAVLIDDYAHHPNEIISAIVSARSTSNGRVLVVFQPHLFSRTSQLATAFADSLTLADAAYVEEIYPSREKESDWPNITRFTILDQIPAAKQSFIRASPSRVELKTRLIEESQEGDTILLLGAGDLSSWARSELI